MKYKVGDEVRIKGTDIGGTVESIIRGQLIVNSKGSKIPSWPEDVDLMKSVEEETVHNKWTGLKVELELSKTVIGISNVESLHGERFMSEFVKAIIPPEGYQFVDENGNVINATKIVLEKKKKEVILTQEQIDTMVHESCVLFCKHCGCGVPRETCTSLGTCKEHDDYRKSIRTHFEKHKK